MRAIDGKVINRLSRNSFPVLVMAVACSLAASCKRRSSEVHASLGVDPRESTASRIQEVDEFLPVGGEKAISADVALAIVRCEGSGAPCREKLGKVLFVAKRGDGRFDVLLPTTRAEFRRNDGRTLTVLTAADLAKARQENGTEFLQLEVQEERTGQAYEATSLGRSVDWRQTTVMLCGTERIGMHKTDKGWECERR